jgi:hypothetical protein
MERLGQGSIAKDQHGLLAKITREAWIGAGSTAGDAVS